MKKIYPGQRSSRNGPVTGARIALTKATTRRRLTVNESERVEFPVPIHFRTKTSREPASSQAKSSQCDPNGVRCIPVSRSFTFYPVFIAYEKIQQTSGCSAAAAHSRLDAPDGQGSCGAPVSRHFTSTVIDVSRVAPGGAGFGAQTRARRFLSHRTLSSSSPGREGSDTSLPAGKIGSQKEDWSPVVRGRKRS